MKRLALALLLCVAATVLGCKGVANSSNASSQPAAGQQIAAGAKVSGTAAKVVIDRDCSKLEDGSDEYVCLKNEDQREADMGAWVIRNVMGRSYNFPTGFKLAPGAAVKLHTGAGTNSGTDLYWNYQVKPAWEKGDKLTLHNNENVEVFVSEPKRG